MSEYTRFLKARADRKQAFLHSSSLQAKLHKAMRIIQLKGRNGHSMNEGLLAQHGIKTKGEPTA